MNIEHLTIHWTAAHPLQVCFPHDQGLPPNPYHFVVTDDGETAHAVQTRSVLIPGAHCWMRNTGNLGSAFAALGRAHVTSRQVEVMSALQGQLAHRFGLRLGDEAVHHKLVYPSPIPVPGEIRIPVLTDHATWAKGDGYYPDRVDVEDLLAEVRVKAAWYLQRIEQGLYHPRLHLA